MSTIELEKELNQTLDTIYGYLNIKGFPSNVYLSEKAEARMGSILGWITGLYHAGSVELANQAAQQFCNMLNRLKVDDVEVSGIKVPRLKYLLHDDGSFNSFGFVTYRPVNAETWQELYDKKLQELDKEDRQHYTARENVTKNVNRQLQIIEEMPNRQDITEHRWSADKHQYVKIRYARGYNGGIIYHGPGAGQTFTVRVGDNSSWWGMHT